MTSSVVGNKDDFQPTVDIERPEELTNYLRSSGRISATESPQIQVLAGGVSNKTVHVRRDSGEEWVLKQALPKLRVKVDWFSDPARIQREAEGIRCLYEICGPGTITKLIFEDPRQYLLCMEAIPEPHENFKSMLMGGCVDAELAGHFGSMLWTIHHRAWKQAGTLAARFDDRSFFESLRLDPYYLYTATQVPQAARFLHDLVRSTRATRLTLVHGDFSPKNVLVHQGKLVLLDHEVIHWGDPGFDIGFAMAHLLSKAHHFHDPRYIEAAHSFWAAYEWIAGPWNGSIGEQRKHLERRAVKHSLGCLLARVAGKSPLEYLGNPQRVRQTKSIIRLMQNPPGTMRALVDRFWTWTGA